MLTCEECGCLVDPEATEIHLNWHKDLVKINKRSVANPDRTKWGEFFVEDCSVNKE